jgi:hypothetical protein
LHYFLAEDAIEVIAVDKRSDDSAPKLLGKRKLLLPQYQHSVNTCAEIKFTASTPSTRRLLDGVAVPLPHRSTEPARPRHRREMHPTHWLISTQVNTPTDKTNTYHWTDLAVGGEVVIFNRRAPASRHLRDMSRRWR